MFICLVCRKGGYVYICGKISMAEGVENALKDVLKHIGMMLDARTADKTFDDNIGRNSRYQEERGYFWLNLIISVYTNYLLNLFYLSIITGNSQLFIFNLYVTCLHKPRRINYKVGVNNIGRWVYRIFHIGHCISTSRAFAKQFLSKYMIIWSRKY